MSKRKPDDQYPFPIDRYDLDRPFFDEVRHTGQPNLQVYQVEDVVVVLGRGSDPDVELHTDAILEDGVRVARRPGGGCSVVLDPGNVVAAVVLPAPGLTRTKEWYERCTAWMIDGLTRMGIEGVRKAGISDLAIGDRKIAGSAVYRAKDIFYYAITFLVTPDLSLIPRYLPHPPVEPDYREGREHLDFVTTLQRAAGMNDPAGFSTQLRAALDLNELMADPD